MPGLDSPLQPGDKFGPYDIERTLGAGGMGVVYLGVNRNSKRRVALKIPKVDDADAMARFQREAQIMKGLRHPNVCIVHDVGEVRGLPYLAMEYIEGVPLSKRIEPGNPWDPVRAVELIRTLAEALQHMHSLGVVHRDLKPDNIMLDFGRPIIMDFGLARPIASDTTLTQTGASLGTPAYMPPEQFKNAKDLGPTADVYTLGAIRLHFSLLHLFLHLFLPKRGEAFLVDTASAW